MVQNLGFHKIINGSWIWRYDLIKNLPFLRGAA